MMRPRPAIHIHTLGRDIYDLVKGKENEIAKHELDDGTLASKSKAVGDTGETELAERRADHTVGKRRRQSARDLEGTAVRVEQILANQHHALIRSHGWVQCPIQVIEDALLHLSARLFCNGRRQRIS